MPTNAQAALQAAATFLDPRDGLDGGVLDLAQVYRDWLDEQDKA
jgi:hypothetical protein